MKSESPQAAGGRARAASMTPEERTDVARRAALARWSKDTRNPYTGMSRDELVRAQQDLRSAHSALQGGQKKIRHQLATLAEALQAAKVEEPDVVVTDHALIRWLERVDGMDLEPIREKIRAMVAGKVSPSNEHDVVVGEKAAVVVRRGLVVTTTLGANQIHPEPGQLRVTSW